MDEGSEGGDGCERPEQEVAANGPDEEAKSSCALAVATSRPAGSGKGNEVFVRSTAVTHVILPLQGAACFARPPALSTTARYLLQALQPCSAPLPQEELADSCPSEIPVSTPPQAARLQEARHTNSGSALAYSQGMI